MACSNCIRVSRDNLWGLKQVDAQREGCDPERFWKELFYALPINAGEVHIRGSLEGIDQERLGNWARTGTLHLYLDEDNFEEMPAINRSIVHNADGRLSFGMNRMLITDMTKMTLLLEGFMHRYLENSPRGHLVAFVYDFAAPPDFLLRLPPNTKMTLMLWAPESVDRAVEFLRANTVPLDLSISWRDSVFNELPAKILDAVPTNAYSSLDLINLRIDDPEMLHKAATSFHCPIRLRVGCYTPELEAALRQLRPTAPDTTLYITSYTWSPEIVKSLESCFVQAMEDTDHPFEVKAVHTTFPTMLSMVAALRRKWK